MSWITDLIKEYPAMLVVKERLESEEKRHEQTKAKNAELQLQVDELTKEVTALRQKLAEKTVLEEYDDKDGYLWKKDGSGPFCPKCRGSMRRFGSGYVCMKCK